MTGKKKTEEKTAQKGKMSLIVFKEIKGIDNMSYAGFKSSINADDGTESTQAEFEKKFKAYKAKEAFITK